MNLPFNTSAWHDATNGSASALGAYAVAEAYGVGSITVNGESRKAIQLRAATSDNPDALVFTGPLGIAASGSGICHAEGIGYAAYTGTLTTGAPYGVDSGASVLSASGAGQFIALGGSFTSGAISVALFMRNPAPVKKFRFTLTSGMSTGTGAADIYEMDGSTSVESGATIKVSMSAFTAMLSGDGGWCFKQGGVYYIGNGNCPGAGA